MRTIQNIFGAIGLFGLMAVQSGCEQEELRAIVSPGGENGIHTVSMSFTGQLHNYEDAITKAGVQWQNGDKLYITFTVGTTTTPGTAVYQDGKWTLTYEGELTVGENKTCTVRYFTSVKSEASGLIGLGSDSGVYEDLAGVYTYSNGTLSVNAILSPKFGRIRMKGEPGTKCLVSGIETISGFYPEDGKYTTGDKALTLNVGDDGYTPYVYGSFANDSKGIGFLDKQNAYTRYFSEDILAAGESGDMSVPTAEAPNNWRSGLYVHVGDVTFRMIGITGYSGGYYLMAETELTNAQYYKVKDNTTSKLPNYPHKLSYSDCLDYISRLNAATGFTFSLPTYNQWVWAAKGGSSSLGRTFAGSDVAIDVAWYNVNAASGAKEVKQKSPNELGLYDMSGNYNEWTSTLENENWAGSYRRAGGCYSDGLEGIKVNSYTYYEGVSTTYFPEGAGMRLCLNVNLE